jgi:alpha-N-acetylglucosaminidase
LPLQKKWVDAFKTKDTASFKKYSGSSYNSLAIWMRCLQRAKIFCSVHGSLMHAAVVRLQAEKALYERNARDLITLWGDANSPLHEYANRQWSGLLNDFYKQRWQQFFDMLQRSLQTNTSPDLQLFEKNIRAWEWHWVNEQKAFPLQPVGKSISKAEEIYNMYRSTIEQAYE